MKTRIVKTSHTDGTRAVYKGAQLVATLSKEKPTRANNRADTYGLAWVSGRFDWFSTYADARDCALKA